VGFWYDRPQQYSGGLNYIRNLLFALSAAGERLIEPYVFFGKHVDAATVRDFESLATVVRTSILDRMSPMWILHRILYRWFGSLLVVNAIARKYAIAVLSHAEHVHGDRRPFKLVSWIPDFQYLHLPELFPGLDVPTETRRMQRILSHTDVLMLSSYAAFEDLKSIGVAASESKVKVLQFVSQPHAGITQPRGTEPAKSVAQRYGIDGEFYYLPNQFWMHKNHGVAFRAVQLAVDQGINLVLVCSGNLVDFRTGTTHCANELRAFIADHHLEPHIRILGTIPYPDVLQLMSSSLAVLNPSRFEGWSSTVEEARSMGKRIILSRIPVHLEQAPPKAIYFDADDAAGLAQILVRHWSSPEHDSPEDRQAAQQDLQRRTLAYARGYTSIITGLLDP
jgi:glycosyltransferase involved in cell wall biosynthesis